MKIGRNAILVKKIYEKVKKYHSGHCKNKFFVLKVLKHDISFVKIATFVLENPHNQP
jgi:hypothetical protein